MRNASVPIQELEGEGYVAVTLAAGRVVAMSFSKDGPNLLWSNPQLADIEILKNAPEKLVGGIGGDRLWFGPEPDYFWKGLPDWQNFSNYQTPSAADPGEYEFVPVDMKAVGLRSKGELRPYGSNQSVRFEVRRTVRLVEPPLSAGDSAMRKVDYVGIETTHVLKLDDTTKVGRMDLWHLLQLPAGSVLIVPLNSKAAPSEKKPLSYGLPGGWVEKPDSIIWRLSGQARAKFGMPAVALTGRAAVLRLLDQNRWCLIVRQFSSDPKARYGDHPYGVPRSDQTLQAWDGFGFGEMEYHSPLLDAELGPREFTESDQLWAFGGSAHAVTAIAKRLLGVDIAYLVRGRST